MDTSVKLPKKEKAKEEAKVKWRKPDDQQLDGYNMRIRVRLPEDCREVENPIENWVRALTDAANDTLEEIPKAQKQPHITKKT